MKSKPKTSGFNGAWDIGHIAVGHITLFNAAGTAATPQLTTTRPTDTAPNLHKNQSDGTANQQAHYSDSLSLSLSFLTKCKKHQRALQGSDISTSIELETVLLPQRVLTMPLYKWLRAGKASFGLSQVVTGKPVRDEGTEKRQSKQERPDYMTTRCF